MSAVLKRFVADASVGLSWAYPGQSAKDTDALLESLTEGTSFLVPGLWFIETANALLVLERRGKIQRDEREEALGALGALPVTVDLEGHIRAFDAISKLAATHALSAYDATYLELALREKLPLATKDAALRAAAKKSGVNLAL